MNADCKNVDWYRILGESIMEYGVEQGIKEVFQAECGEYIFANFVEFLDADLYSDTEATLTIIKKLLESYLENYGEVDRLDHIMTEITKEVK
ncbi:hypothetical protein vBAcePPAc_0019 [Aeromonas phage vB_AceP_PAc]|nr:hypothetical protein vBAcePPAc_0019 [Aeromonas phage vB_AceP_PAc]